MKVSLLKWAAFIVCAAMLAAEAFPTMAQSKAKQAKKVIRLDAIKIEGRIQKPEAFLVFNRANLNHQTLEEPEQFTHKIVESLKEEPF